MSTQQTANVYIRNDTGGVAYIQLFHQNSSSGTQNGSWQAAAGEIVGPLTVHFETGWGSYSVLDWWGVVAAVVDGPAAGVYQNAGTVAFPGWKECQLQSKDAGRTITLSVSTSAFNVSLASGGCTDGMKTLRRGGSKITNVFVLMLENHSFDNIFGQSGIPGITHATPADSNAYGQTSYSVGSPAPTSMPTDPGHEFLDVVEQLCGPGMSFLPGPYPEIFNSGFATNYAVSTSEGPAPARGEIGDIMLGFDTPTQLPVMYALATEFALCDHWFSSLPGPTWPNRFFVHGASSAGLDHSPKQEEMAEWETVHGFSYPRGSIFDALTRAGHAWRLYNDFHDDYSNDRSPLWFLGAMAQVASLKGIDLTDVHSMRDFATDLQAPYTYPYTFIEPNYGDVTGSYSGGSSQHPMDDVYGGEGLLKAVYEAIRNSPVWNTSLLIVTYDEHGGFYDSVKPPAAPPPADGSGPDLNRYGFEFDRYGVRVPAVVVSPWVAKGVVDSTLYDHASVPKTLESILGFGPLTARDNAANDVLRLLSETRPRTDTPNRLPDPAPPAPRAAGEEELGADDDEPIATSGNLVGFLGAALSTEAALTATTDAERQALIAQYAAITTRGEARERLARVAALVEAHRSPGPNPVAGA